MDNNKKNIEEIIDEFAENNGKYKENLTKLYDKCGKERPLLDLEDYEILEAILEVNKSIMSPKVMFTTRFAYSQFWEWALEKKYTKLQNPFNTSQFLERTAMIIAFAESKIDVKVLTPKDIDRVLNHTVEKSGETGYIQEFMIRALFEGVKSLRDLAQIRVSQIDFENRTIELKGKKKKFSQKFFNSLETYNNLTSISYQKNGSYTVDLIRYKDYLIKFNRSATEKQNQFQDDDDFIKKTTQKLSYHLNKFKTKADIDFSIKNNVLFYSGLIEHIRQKVENQQNPNSLMTCMIFYKGSNPTGLSLIEILEEYDYNYKRKKRSTNIEREILQLFLIKSPYFDPKALYLEEDADDLFYNIIL